MAFLLFDPSGREVCKGARRGALLKGQSAARHAAPRRANFSVSRAAPRPIFFMPRRAAYDKKWGRGIHPAPRSRILLPRRSAP